MFDRDRVLKIEIPSAAPALDRIGETLAGLDTGVANNARLAKLVELQFGDLATAFAGVASLEERKTNDVIQSTHPPSMNEQPGDAVDPRDAAPAAALSNLGKIIAELGIVAYSLETMRARELTDGEHFMLHPRVSEYAAYILSEKMPPDPRVIHALFLLLTMPESPDAVDIARNQPIIREIFVERSVDKLKAHVEAWMEALLSQEGHVTQAAADPTLWPRVLPCMQRLTFHATVISYRRFSQLRPADRRAIDDELVQLCKHPAVQIMIGDPLTLGIKATALSASSAVGDLILASSFAEAAVNFFPDQPGILHTAARLLLKLAETLEYEELIDLDRCYETATRALTFDPEYPRYFLTRGRIATRLQRFDQALADFHMARFIAKMPGNEAQDDGKADTFEDEIDAALEELRNRHDLVKNSQSVSDIADRVNRESQSVKSQLDANTQQYFQLQQKMKQWDTDILEMKKQVRSTEQTSLTLLGLIGAVLAIIVSAPQTIRAVAKGQPLDTQLLAFGVTVLGLMVFLGIFFFWLWRRDKAADKRLGLSTEPSSHTNVADTGEAASTKG